MAYIEFRKGKIVETVAVPRNTLRAKLRELRLKRFEVLSVSVDTTVS